MRKLLLREKVLIISSILCVVSIPLLLINKCFMVASSTVFIISIFYNMYKIMRKNKLTISSAIKIDIEKARKELEEGDKFSGTIRMIALPFAIGVGIPVVCIILICLWVSLFI